MLAACAAPEGAILPDLTAIGQPSAETGTARMPRDIRLGVVDMVIQRVEDNVSPEEVAAAIEPMLAAAPVCMRWPALWLERVQRDMFVVRYGLMARDWGESAAAAAQEQMDEFVAIGFLTAAPALSPDSRAVEYRLTAAGERYLSGLIEPGRRPQFCAPAERHLVEITEMQWGQYPCGTLQVRFNHVGENWPAWATTESTRARLAATWPPVGEASPGVVSLSRQWYRREDVPSGYTNGSLRSLCYDPSRRIVTGNDLNLSVAPAD
jgi:hypothetical protein